MSTFSELAALGNGAGVTYLLEGNVDDVGTVDPTYAFSFVDGRFDQSFAYEARIIELGDLQRGFGHNGTVAASTFTARLNNMDGGCDSLLTPTVGIKNRWRLRCVLFDSNNPSDFAIKTLGMFVPLDFPKRDDRSVMLQLADDSFGRAAELAIPPTADEAFGGALVPATTQPPVPIAMGGGEIPCIPPSSYDPTATQMDYVLCATTDSAVVDPNEMTRLIIRGAGLSYGAQYGDHAIVGAVETLALAGGPPVNYPLWEVKKTASLTKDGRTWKILYVRIYTDNLRNWLTGSGYLARDTITMPPITGTGTWPVTMSLEYFNTQLLPQLELVADGPTWSSITYGGTRSAFTQTVTIRAPDIVYDLLRYYSRGLTAAQVPQASFTAATAAFPLFFFKARYYFTNFVQNVTSVRQGTVLARNQVSALANLKGIMLQAVSTLCQGGLFDVVTSWAGEFTAHVLANTFALQTTTPISVDETLMIGTRDRIPSSGERWAPYNRVVFGSNGRIVDNATAIASWGSVLARTINDSAVDVFESFSGTDFGIGTFGGIGVLESVVRPILEFDYPLDSLDWELGQFIAVTWTQSGRGVYSGAVFRIESLTLHPAGGRVSVSAVWIDDLRTSNPYLLDDEALLVRGKGALTGSATCNGTQIVTFGGTINLTTMGVLVGDILILLDSSQAAGVFTRYAAFQITNVSGTTTIEVIDYTGAAPSIPAGVVVNADWSIVRGATTYPTAVSDPANYPSGGAMYGKQSTTGLFSDGSTANKFTNAG